MRQRLTSYFKTFELKTEIALTWAEARFEILSIVAVCIVAMGVVAVA